jgi:hypothetical protein
MHKTKDKMCYTENEVISMLEFIMDNNIFILFDLHSFSKSSTFTCEHTTLLIFQTGEHKTKTYQRQKNCIS